MIKKQLSAPLLTGQRHELQRKGWVSQCNSILRPRPWILWGALLLSLLFNLGPALAQEPEPAPANADVAPTSRAHLFITGSNGERAPAVQLRLYGLAPGGTPLDFNQSPLAILHGDTAVEDITITGQEEVGTLTLFLVDNPPGVQQQQTAIQAAIQQYASQTYMREGLDYVAVYQVAANGATELLSPTQFYNSVTNLFIDPLPVQGGPTALIDSTYQLLNQMEAIKPVPEVAPVLVVLSDGTDAVSTQTPENLLATAAQIGVPVHTVLLNNSNLSNPNAGAGFMQALAQVSNGLASSLDAEGGLSRIFERIVALRLQTLVRYFVPLDSLDVGQFPVRVALAEDTAVQATTSVTITAERPLVTIDVPTDSRTLVLPNLDSPTELSLPVTVSWLNGTEQELTQAQLLVNGQPVYNIPVAQVARFSTAVPNLVYGPNSVQVVVIDSSGQQGVGEITLTVNQGDSAVIPDALQANGLAAGGGSLTNILLGCLFALLAFGALLFLAYTLRDWPLAKQIGLDRWLDKLPQPRQRRRRGAKVTVSGDPVAPQSATPFEQQPAASSASNSEAIYLDVVEAVTNVVGPLPLRQVEIRIGRAPAQSDICFENDITVSRIHASLILEGNSYRIFDEQSTSGTLVNGQPVPEYGTLLFDGDEILLGAVRLRYRA